MQEHILIDNIKTLNQVNFQIGELVAMKAKLEEVILEAINPGHTGQKTYYYGAFKVTIDIPVISTLNVENYKYLKSTIPKSLNPVTESTVYKICKKKLNYIISSLPREERLFLDDIVVDRPGTKKIKLGANA